MDMNTAQLNDYEREQARLERLAPAIDQLALDMAAQLSAKDEKDCDVFEKFAAQPLVIDAIYEVMEFLIGCPVTNPRWPGSIKVLKDVLDDAALKHFRSRAARQID